MRKLGVYGKPELRTVKSQLPFAQAEGKILWIGNLSCAAKASLHFADF